MSVMLKFVATLVMKGASVEFVHSVFDAVTNGLLYNTILWKFSFVASNRDRDVDKLTGVYFW